MWLVYNVYHHVVSSLERCVLIFVHKKYILFRKINVLIREMTLFQSLIVQSTLSIPQNHVRSRGVLFTLHCTVFMNNTKQLF